MPIQISRQQFDSLDDRLLGEACFAPIIPEIRGKDTAAKKEVYDRLTAGQRALFMFSAYYNHAKNSLAEVYWWSAYFLAQPKVWTELKAGLRYFGADEMLQVLEEMERTLKTRNHLRGLGKFDASYKDIDEDTGLLAAVSSLHAVFQEISPAVLQKIGQCIRSNPSEFVQFDD
ncbi:MAG: hypothetical protein ACE3JN_02795 [Ectobacillus sp.]